MRPLPRCALVAVTALIVGLWSSVAAAHIEITSHIDRHGRDDQKQGPCGAADGGERGDAIYAYEPGASVKISWNEYIDHPGHFRVAFDDDGDDAFADPATGDELYTNAAVLLDGIPDEAKVEDYEVEVTLPDIECERCTIQVIQVMTDKPPFGDGNDVYYHCIDVRLVPGGGEGPEPAGAGGCACSVDPYGEPVTPLALLLLLGVIRRMRF